MSSDQKQPAHNEAPDADALWNAKDVARYFRASRNWVYDQVAAGKLPHVKLGGLVRFHPDQIRALARGEPVPAARVVAFAAGGKG